MPAPDHKKPQEVRRPLAASGECESCEEPWEFAHWEQAGLQRSNDHSSDRSNVDARSFQELLDVISERYNKLARRSCQLMEEVQLLTAEWNLSGQQVRSSLLSTVDEDKSVVSDYGRAGTPDSLAGGSGSSKNSMDLASASNMIGSSKNSMDGLSRTSNLLPRPSARNSNSARGQSCRGSSGLGSVLTDHSLSAARGSQGIRSKSSTLSMSQMQRVFPAWYDPEVSGDGHKTSAGLLQQQAVMRLMSRNLEAREGMQKAKCVLSPVGPFRLFWDFSAMLCLLYDFWSIPIALVFITNNRIPFAMKVLDWVLVVFFSFDIILNLRTGYLLADRIVWNPQLIVRHYLRAWFLVDFVATAPWDKIFDLMTTDGGDYSAVSLVRSVKIAKAVKTIRFLRLAHATRIVKSMDLGENFHDFYAICSFFLSPIKVLLVFLLSAHITGSIWAAAQPHWKATDDLQDAFRMYYQSVWWAFMALTVGSVGGTHSGSDRALLWSIDMLVAAERLCLIAWLFVYGSLRLAASFQDRVRLTKEKADATNYLRKRDVSVATQLQVLFSIWETGQARIMRNRFEEIILGDLPTELQRKVCEELWSGPLLSLGLIMHVSHWNEDLVAELALVAREEVFASKSIVFQEGNAAIAAYYIMDGTISVLTSLSTHPIPDFTRGMWLGEKALVNPMLRRSGTAVCNTMSTVMCMHGESFQTVLSSLGVTENFQVFCNEFLWRGLCGRCGLLGDHFTSECPRSDPSVRVFKKLVEIVDTANSEVSKQGRLTNRLASLSMKPEVSETDRCGRLDKKLRQFLLVQHLEWLEPALINQGITELEELRTVDKSTLRNELQQISEGDETLVLTEDAERAFSPEAVDKFSQALQKQTGDVLFLNVGRSQHFLFLSHFKVEAGTEAALIRNELEKMIDKDPGSPANQFSCPIFLDSEDLTNLSLLQSRVRQSHNIALLLTKSVLSRPWVLVELATAFEARVHVIPVLLLRGFDQFAFPDEEFYQSIRDGSLLGQGGCEVLEECGIDRSNVEHAIRATFQRIAVPYSPHRPESIRQSELQSLLKHCRLKRAFLPDKNHKNSAQESIESVQAWCSQKSL